MKISKWMKTTVIRVVLTNINKYYSDMIFSGKIVGKVAPGTLFERYPILLAPC